MNHALTKGIYCLTIKLVKKHTIRVGCLGNFGFPRGFYVYVGSAQNNLEDRIERHLQRDKKMHWHIDYLLHYGQVSCVHTYAAEKNAECMLSQKIGNIKNAVILVSGFGSSDCSCASHLYFFQDNPDFRISRIKLGCRRQQFLKLPSKKRGLGVCKHAITHPLIPSCQRGNYVSDNIRQDLRNAGFI